MNFRKLGLILLFLAVTAGAGYLLYRVFFAPAPTAEQPTTGVPAGAGTGLPTAGTGRPVTPAVPGGIAPSGTVPSAAGSEIAAGGKTATQQVISGNVLDAQAGPGGELDFYNQTDGKFYRRLPDGSLQAMSETTFPSVSKVSWSGGNDKAVLEFPDGSKVIYDFE